MSYVFHIGNKSRLFTKKGIAHLDCEFVVFSSDEYENKEDAIRDAKKKADEMGHIVFAIERLPPNVTFFSKGFCDTGDGWGVLE